MTQLIGGGDYGRKNERGWLKLRNNKWQRACFSTKRHYVNRRNLGNRPPSLMSPWLFPRPSHSLGEGNGNPLQYGLEVAQTVKHLSTMWETRVRSLGWEDPLEKEMAIHSRTIAWKIPWTEEPGRLQSMESQTVGHDWATSLSLSHYISNIVLGINLCNY